MTLKNKTLSPSDLKGLPFNDQVDLESQYFSACMYKTKQVGDFENYKPLFIPEVYENRNSYAEVSVFFLDEIYKCCVASIGLYFELSDFGVGDPDFVSISDGNDELVLQCEWRELSKEWRLFIDSLDCDILLYDYIVDNA